MDVTILEWREPNRANTPPLHIASRGERYSTVTGVWWLDEHRLVANHQCGLRLAMFDLRQGNRPVAALDTPVRTDHIGAKKLDEDTWEIAVSCCWEAAFSLFRLSTLDEPSFKHVHTEAAKDRTFCHGASYDGHGHLCLAYHTGADPRIDIGGAVTRLPAPWGPRYICHSADEDTYYAVAVSNNPARQAYQQTNVSLWSRRHDEHAWKMILHRDNFHSDSCQVYRERIWLPDQHGDRVIGFCLKGEKTPVILSGKCFDFPHGLAISPGGMLAVTNYGNSSVSVLNISNVDF
jgi:hypothetical protein